MREWTGARGRAWSAGGRRSSAGSSTPRSSVLLARLAGERVLLLEPIVEQLALRLSVDPTADVRPRSMAHAVNAAVTAAWFTTRIDPGLDWVDLIEESLDVLERGLVPSCLRAGAVGRRPADVA